jgi:hypothetical protein
MKQNSALKSFWNIPLAATIRIPVSARRKRRQRGLEVIEFGLFAIMMMPAFVWMYTTGMNFVRFDKANDVVRSAALMYIKNTDMNVLGSQELVARVAEGLDLEVDDGATPPNQVLNYSRGSGLVVLSTVQYVGSGTCNSCTNTGYYVFLDRVYIGNRSLQINGSTVGSALGDPAAAIWNSTTGDVSSNYTDSRARVASSFAGLWSPSMADGQIGYVVEAYFAGTFGTGNFGGNGIYARVFM